MRNNQRIPLAIGSLILFGYFTGQLFDFNSAFWTLKTYENVFWFMWPVIKLVILVMLVLSATIYLWEMLCDWTSVLWEAFVEAVNRDDNKDKTT